MSIACPPQVWPNVKEQICPRGRGPCSEALEFTVGKVYLQVMFGVAMLYSCVILMPGKKGLLGAMVCMCLTMGKHLTVDGLVPPPPSSLYDGLVPPAVITILALLVAPDEWGKRIFVGYCFFNALTFITQPLMVLSDTFPEIKAGTVPYEVGSFSLEVVALYFVMAGITAAVPSALGLAFACQVGAAVIAKHVLINNSGPPTPMILLWTVATFTAWYEVRSSRRDSGRPGARMLPSLHLVGHSQRWVLPHVRPCASRRWGGRISSPRARRRSRRAQ